MRGPFSAVSKPIFVNKDSRESFLTRSTRFTDFCTFGFTDFCTFGIQLKNRSDFKTSAKFRQTFSQFYSFMFILSPMVCNCCPKFTNLDEKFSEFQQFLRTQTRCLEEKQEKRKKKPERKKAKWENKNLREGPHVNPGDYAEELGPLLLLGRR